MQTLNLIGADWSPADSGGTFPVLDPADDALIAEVPACGADEARWAIIAADSARDRLAGMGVTERCGMLSAISTAMDDGMEDLAVTITREQGKPLHESRAEIQQERTERGQRRAREVRRPRELQMPAGLRPRD